MQTQLESWIQLATRAPSGDNNQPWDFGFEPGHFKITINKVRASHFLDQSMSASWISMGCLCENLERSADFFGFSCQVSISSDHSVTVKYQPTEQRTYNNIAEVITRRQTFRGELNKVEIDLKSLDSEFPTRKNDPKQFKWLRVSEVSKKLIWQWSWLESILWLRTPLMADFTKHIHKKNERHEYGFSLESLQVSLTDQISLMLFKKKPTLTKLVPTWFLRFQTYFRLKFLIQRSSGLLCLSGVFSDFRDYFYAGKEIQRMWLYLTQKNLKAQPLAIQSLFLNFADSDSVRESLTEDQIRRIKSIKEETQAEFKVTQNLIFMFRYGTTQQSLPLLPRKKIVINT